MRMPCACQFREIDTDDATYVINGIGYCEKACIDRVGSHGRPFRFNAPRPVPTRIVGAHDGFKVEG